MIVRVIAVGVEMVLVGLVVLLVRQWYRGWTVYFGIMIDLMTLTFIFIIFCRKI